MKSEEELRQYVTMQIKRILRKTQKRRRKICFFRVMFLSLQKSEL